MKYNWRELMYDPHFESYPDVLYVDTNDRMSSPSSAFERAVSQIRSPVDVVNWVVRRRSVAAP